MRSLLLVLVCAAVFDLLRHRVPNPLLLAGLTAAMVGAAAGGGPHAAATVLTGTAVGLLLLLPFHLKGAVGAGDVKLLAVAGAFLGPASAFWALCYSLLFGLVGALTVLVRGRGVTAFAQRYGVMLVLLLRGRPAYLGPGADEHAASARFPYAAAIGAGAMLAALAHGVTGGAAWLP